MIDFKDYKLDNKKQRNNLRKNIIKAFNFT